MRERIRLYFSLVTGVALLLFCAAVLYWMNGRFESNARQSLRNYLFATIELSPEAPEDPQAFVRGLAKNYAGNVRITVTDLEGNVLGDSGASYADMADHSDRLEFVDAAATGYGEAVRPSATTGVSMLYAAAPWGEGHYLRFAMPLSDFYSNTLSLLPVLLVSLLVVFALASVFSKWLLGKIMAPYDAMSEYIRTAMKEEGELPAPFETEYEEMRPVAEHFRFLALRLHEHIDEIRAKSREIEDIAAAMEEGLILLDESLEVLLINGQGRRFLDLPEGAAGRRITHLYREERFAQALSAAKESRQRQILDIRLPGGRTCRFYINPVSRGGFVLLLSDVSELVRLEQVRSEFAANVSHELKTPLTSISGFAELINAGLVSVPEQVREYAGKIHNETGRLVMLIEDILRLSAIENGGETGELTAVDMQEVFDYALEMLAPQVGEKAVSASVEGDLEVRAVREHMVELAVNLCDNAVKYNKEGGSVRVVLGDKGFRVEDTGIGIPPDELDRVFERFYRVDKARSRKTGGTGLGLSIAKHICELYGGTIRAMCVEGVTTMEVELPRA